MGMQEMGFYFLNRIPLTNRFPVHLIYSCCHLVSNMCRGSDAIPVVKNHEILAKKTANREVIASQGAELCRRYMLQMKKKTYWKKS